jgi:PilZ domain
MSSLAPRLGGRPIERRRHSRVPVVVLGRYMLASRQEFPCQTRDISIGGVAVIAPVKGEIGTKVIVYLEHLGRLEGTVVRHIQDGFAMNVMATPRKRDKLASQLTWLANRHVLGLPEDRRHDRVVPRNPRTMIKMKDGTEHTVRLLDVSLSGCAFTADVELMIGDAMQMGRSYAHVVRKFADGYAVEFRDPLRPDALHDNMVL